MYKRTMIWMLVILLISSMSLAAYKGEVYDYQGYHTREKINYSVLNADNLTANTRILSEGNITLIGLYGINNPMWIDFNTSEIDIPHKEGRLHWDYDEGTLELGTDKEGVKTQIGRELIAKVVNKCGNTIYNGNVVYVFGAQGNRATVACAIANNTQKSSVIGMVTQDSCAVNNECYITLIGYVNELDTSMYSVGDFVYLSPTEKCNYTNVKPMYPDYVVKLGVVTTAHAIQGRIAFEPELDYTDGVTLNSLGVLNGTIINKTLNVTGDIILNGEIIDTFQVLNKSTWQNHSNNIEYAEGIVSINKTLLANYSTKIGDFGVNASYFEFTKIQSGATIVPYLRAWTNVADGLTLPYAFVTDIVALKPNEILGLDPAIAFLNSSNEPVASFGMDIDQLFGDKDMIFNLDLGEGSGNFVFNNGDLEVNGIRATREINTSTQFCIGTSCVSQWWNHTDINVTKIYSGNIFSYDNISADEFLKGQPLSGMLGSGIIKSSSVNPLGEVNVTCVGLTCSYNNFEVRLVTTDNVETYCNITAGDFTITDNQHTVVYVDNNCDIQQTSIQTYIETPLSPGGISDFANVIAVDNMVYNDNGLSIENKRIIKLRKLLFETMHLEIQNGFNYKLGAFPTFNISAGEYVYLMDIEDASPQSTLTDNIEAVYHTSLTSWGESDKTGLNITSCDNGTGVVICPNTNLYRRIFIFDVGYNNTNEDFTQLHQLLPSRDITYTTLAQCTDVVANPLTYTLPEFYQYSAVMLYAYCARPSDNSWNDGWIDLRTVKQSSATGGIDTAQFLTKDGTTPLTANWNAGNYNITATKFNATKSICINASCITSWNQVNITSGGSGEGNASREFGHIVGYTALTYDGNLSNGTDIGYVAGNAICDANYEGSHFCLESEIVRDISNGNYAYTDTVWVSKGAPGFIANANDCKGWTDNSGTYLGPFWNWDGNAQGGYGVLTVCSQEKPLICCR